MPAPQPSHNPIHQNQVVDPFALSASVGWSRENCPHIRNFAITLECRPAPPEPGSPRPMTHASSWPRRRRGPAGVAHCAGPAARLSSRRHDRPRGLRLHRCPNFSRRRRRRWGVALCYRSAKRAAVRVPQAAPAASRDQARVISACSSFGLGWTSTIPAHGSS